MLRAGKCTILSYINLLSTIFVEDSAKGLFTVVTLCPFYTDEHLRAHLIIHVIVL